MRLKIEGKEVGISKFFFFFFFFVEWIGLDWIGVEWI